MDGGKAPEGRRVDIAHEALISGWPQLQQWLAERREAEQTRRRLEDKAAEWVRLGRGRGGLLDEAELPEAERWLAGPDATPLGYGEMLPALVAGSRAAIDTTEQERETTRQRELHQAQTLAAEQRQRAEEQGRAARRFRWLAAGLGLVFLFAAVAAFIALGQRQQALTEAGGRATEVVQRGYAEATAQGNAQLAATRAAEAVAAASTAQAERGRAGAQAATAEAARLVAEGAAGTAEVERSRAETERARADRQSQIALARALAAEAPRQHEAGQDQRGALLARQGFLFNQAVDGSAGAAVDAALRSVLGTENFSHVIPSYQDFLHTVAFSPDGQTLASGGFHGSVRLWDLRTADPTAAPRVLTGHDPLVRSVAFSPDGRMLASSSHDGTVRLWDLTAADPATAPVVLHGHEAPVSSVAFSPAGQALASGSDDRTMRLWDLTAADPAADPIVLTGHAGAVNSVAFSPDGHTLASGSTDNTVRLWIAQTEVLSNRVCEIVWHNLTMEEWQRFVGPDVPYASTCPKFLPGEGAPGAPGLDATPAASPAVESTP
jgi:hypothetical protein